MEGVVHRGGWNKKASVSTILLMLQCMFLPALTLLQSTEKPTLTCFPHEYLNPNGFCCPRCGQGLRLVEMCNGPGQSSNCTACPKGQYTDELNYSTKCDICTICYARKHEVEKEECKPSKDTVCECAEGYYKSKIDSTTYQCKKCNKCRANEKEIKPCDRERNTLCGCQENYYKVAKKCLPCENCTTGCDQLCKASTATIKVPEPSNKDMVNVIVGIVVLAVVLVVLVAVVTFLVTKRQTKKKLQKSTSQSTNDSPDLFTQILITDEGPSNDIGLNAVPQRPACEQEQPSSLPDCVPFEVKWPDLVYMVLDVVPVLRVKELVRSLGVRDMEIEQIELDYQSCREAHYQMLRAWVERGSRGAGGGLLQQPLLQELLGKLREMHLGRAAEELETKYGIQ